MESGIGEEGGRFERGVMGIVVRVFGDREEGFPVGLTVVAVESEVLL